MKVTFDKNFEKELLHELNISVKNAIKLIILDTEAAQSLRNIRNLKKLKGYKNFYRIKLNYYRIGLKIENGIICFITYGQRKDFYKYFPK